MALQKGRYGGRGGTKAKALAGGIAGFMNIKKAFEMAKLQHLWKKELQQEEMRGGLEKIMALKGTPLSRIAPDLATGQITEGGQVGIPGGRAEEGVIYGPGGERRGEYAPGYEPGTAEISPVSMRAKGIPSTLVPGYEFAEGGTAATGVGIESLLTGETPGIYPSKFQAGPPEARMTFDIETPEGKVKASQEVYKMALNSTKAALAETKYTSTEFQKELDKQYAIQVGRFYRAQGKEVPEEVANAVKGVTQKMGLRERIMKIRANILKKTAVPFVKKALGGNAGELLSALMRGEELSPGDMRELEEGGYIVQGEGGVYAR